MRATSFAFRLWAAGFAITSMSACAEGGLADADLDNEQNQDDGTDKDSGSSTSRDAGKDARSTSNSDDDDTSTPTRDAGGGSSTGSKDSGTGTSTGSKDAGTSTGGGTAAAIKCPSPLICTDQTSLILSAFGTGVQSTDKLCANTGSVLPSGISCTTDDACKGARLTTASCKGGYCIQPCTP